MSTLTFGYAMCGSFCTFKQSLEQMKKIVADGYQVVPIMSPISYTTDTRFGKAKDFIEEIESTCGRKIIHSIVEAEPIGPKKMVDVMIVCPCTGNTLAKLANSITDTAVTMAVKSHLRNSGPVVLALATNDALSGSAKNIGKLMNYKNIYFSFMFQFQYGNDVYNATRMFNTQSQDERSNQLAEVADRWTPTNASNRVPSAKGYVKYELYSRFVEDGSFLRLKNVTLGYTLPNKWTKKAYINRLRVYGTAQNLFCLTKYSGYDPEVNMKSSPLMPGFDWGAYPKSRVFTFGVEVQF